MSTPSLTSPRCPPPDDEIAALVRDEVVLVTGAAGSLGSAAARKLARLGPRRLLLLDQAETDLLELADELDPGSATPLLGDVGDERVLDRIFRTDAPRFVVHTAALKHVVGLERQPLAAIRTNVLGTAALAERVEASRALLVSASTDKAVEPISVLGATKEIAEQLVLRIGPSGAVARLVNVLDSRGSLGPRLRARQALGQRLEVRDLDATRFVMTTADAVSVMLSAWLSPSIGPMYAPEPSIPVTVRELVMHFLGTPCDDVVVTGLEAGEKRHERLFAPGETWVPTRRPGLWTRTAPEARPVDLEPLRQAVAVGDSTLAMQALVAACPTYRPSSGAGRPSP